MNLLLQRRTSTKHCTIGDVYDDKEHLCVTLEDVVREERGIPVERWKVPGCTAIPQGVYSVIITPSQRFKRPLPLLVGVVGFSGIRIHPGNRDVDTEGCILPGSIVGDGGDSVLYSVIAFNELFSLIEDALKVEDVWIEIRNAVAN